MAKMKNTVADSRPRPPASQHALAENDIAAEDAPQLTYEKKGKRKAPGRQVAPSLQRVSLGSDGPNAEEGSQVKRKGSRSGPASKQKFRRSQSESMSAGSSHEASDGGSSDQQEVSPPSKRKKVAVQETLYSEDDCRRELNKLAQPSKRPPVAMSEDIFHTSCKLPRDGLNPHRLRMEKDVKLKDVEALFGEEKGRNGFLITERLTPTLRKEVESLYCQIYQKTQCSTHVGKELAMGWTLQTQGHGINWAGYAAETNLGQRKAYARRVKAWLTRLASAQNKKWEDVVQAEPISKYLHVTDEKKPCIQLFRAANEESAEVVDVKHRPPTTSSLSFSDAYRRERLAEVQELVNFVSTVLQKLESEAEDLQVKADRAADQQRASLLGIQQVQETMNEMGVDGGSEIMQRLLEGYSKKMTDFTAAEAHLRSSLDDVTAKVLGTQSRLAALQDYLQDLSRGGHGILLHPHPQLNDITLDETLPAFNADITLTKPRCSACMEGFPYGDILLCECKHVYHPWCAGQWFKDTSLCAHLHCGEVHPLWLKSWGFPLPKSHGTLREEGIHGDNYPRLPSRAPSSIMHGPLEVLGGLGAPSMSASDSTLSKCLGQEKSNFGHNVLLLHDSDRAVEVKAAATAEGAVHSNPFDSKCSTVSTGLKESCTSAPPPASSPTLECPARDSILLKTVGGVQSATAAGDTVAFCEIKVHHEAAVLTAVDSEVPPHADVEQPSDGSPRGSPLAHDKPPSKGKMMEDVLNVVDAEADEDPWDITVSQTASVKANDTCQGRNANMDKKKSSATLTQGQGTPNSVPSALQGSVKGDSSGKASTRPASKPRSPHAATGRQLRSRTSTTATISAAASSLGTAAAAQNLHEVGKK